MPRLKLMVEDILHKYLVGEITDEEFKEGTRIILEEFEGKDYIKTSGNLFTQWKRRIPIEGMSSKRYGLYSTRLIRISEKTL